MNYKARQIISTLAKAVLVILLMILLIKPARSFLIYLVEGILHKEINAVFWNDFLIKMSLSLIFFPVGVLLYIYKDCFQNKAYLFSGIITLYFSFFMFLPSTRYLILKSVNKIIFHSDTYANYLDNFLILLCILGGICAIFLFFIHAKYILVKSVPSKLTIALIVIAGISVLIQIAEKHEYIWGEKNNKIIFHSDTYANFPDNFLILLCIFGGICAIFLFFIHVKHILVKSVPSKLTIALIVIAGLSVLIQFAEKPDYFWGESDDMAIPLVTIPRHLSIQVTNEDIEYSKTIFPGIYPYFRGAFDGTQGTLLRWKDGNVYSCYFPTYAIACLPIKAMMGFFALNQDRCLQITNLLVYLAALVFAFFTLKRINPWHRFIVIVCLAVSPIVVYPVISSYETFIYACVTIAALQFYNRSFKSAAFFASLAASSNLAVSGICFFIFIAFFYNLFQGKKVCEFSSILKANIYKIIIFFICYAPVIISMLYTKIIFGVFSVFALSDFHSTSKGILLRMFAKLFDINFGYAAYYPILIVLFFCGLLYCIFKKRIYEVLFGFGFLFSLALYCMNQDIDGGMIGLHRYAVHILPMLLVFTGLVFISVLNKFWKKIVLLIYAISVVVCFIFVKINSNYNHLEMNPLSKLILDTHPSLYNPLSSTFIARVIHIDGEQDYNLSVKPVIYNDKDGYARKILVNRKSAAIIQEAINKRKYSGIDEAGNFVFNIIEHLAYPQNKGMERYNKYGETEYINIPQKIQIAFSPSLIFSWGIVENLDVPKDLNLREQHKINIGKFTSGVYGIEAYIGIDPFAWMTPDALIGLKHETPDAQIISIDLSTGIFNIPTTQIKPSYIEFLVNDVLTETVPVTNGGRYTITINTADFPEIDQNVGYYLLEIRTDGVYNPQKAGDSTDGRNLSFQLFGITQSSSEYNGDDSLAKAKYRSLDFSANPDLFIVARGAWGIENRDSVPFTWLLPVSEFYLLHDSSNPSTLSVDLAPTIFHIATTQNKPTKIEFFVNGFLTETVLVTSGERRTVTIDTSKYPALQQDKGYYLLEIRTDGVYNPEKAGASADNRDLSLQLFGITQISSSE